MNIPHIAPKWKFLTGLAFYALVIVILSLFDDYRIIIYGFMLMNALAFAMALWAVCHSKKTVAMILAASLALAPTRGGSGEMPPSSPTKNASVIWACGVLIVGGIIVWSLWKLCKRLPGPPRNPGNPPGTNHPPEELWSPYAGHTLPPIIMPDTDITASASEYETMVMHFQKSTDGVNWVTAYTATNWAGPTYVFSVLYTNGVPLMTNQCDAHWTNETMVLDFSSVMESQASQPLMMWRAVQAN